jgi:argininosuccinate lyase
LAWVEASIPRKILISSCYSHLDGSHRRMRRRPMSSAAFSCMVLRINRSHASQTLKLQSATKESVIETDNRLQGWHNEI